MSLFLTPEELREMTGFCRPSKQIEWLRANGFSFRIAADGHPRVLASHVQRVMGGQTVKEGTTPDFSKLVA